ncbi:MAG: carboxymuconolactone decarboxylase family protein [Microbacteriaceae bacterium]|nr:carboxymuconolactone decarboxylase family protein [Microbacteriaceae bacterium]
MPQRFTPPDRADYTERQREFYDRYASGPRANPDAAFHLIDAEGRLIGPPAIWVLSPETGFALAAIGYQMRWGIGFSERAREAVILAVGYTLESPFELYAHERAGRAAGWTDDDFAEIAARRTPATADAEVEAVLAATWEILDTGTLSDAAYAATLEALGLEHLFHLVALVSYYRMVATQLAVFGVLPPG